MRRIPRQLTPAARRRRALLKRRLLDLPPSTLIELMQSASMQAGARQEMAAFDSLPKALRERIASSAYGRDARGYARAMADGTADLASKGLHASRDEIGAMLAGVIEDFELHMLRRFAELYRQRYGQDLPHLAAGATFQR